MKLPNNFITIPCEGKRPLVRWADYQTKAPSKEELNSWSVLYPDAGVGIVTGKKSGLFVLDDDGGLEKSGYEIPRTWKVITPRGGVHYYFRWDSRLDIKITTKTGILDKVDVRGEGGFAAHYGFEKLFYPYPMALAPQWLVDLLPLSSTNDTLTKFNHAEALQNIKEGNRNETLFKLGSGLRARGLNLEAIYKYLLPTAKEVGIDENELQTICQSMCRYPMGQGDQTSDSLQSFMSIVETVEWIVPSIISKRSIGFVAGLPETGKTWIMMDLAIEMARGGIWLEKFPVMQGNVLFIDQERFKGETQRRLKVLINGKGSSISELTNSLFVQCGTTIRLDLQNSYEAFRRTMQKIRPQLVIVDSFVTFHTKEENDRTGIQIVLERIKELRNEFSCTFIFLDHENKSTFSDAKDGVDPSYVRMVGSIAKSAAAEFIFTVRKSDSESSMVYHTKSTLSSTIAPFLIKVEDMNQEKTKIRVKAY